MIHHHEFDTGTSAAHAGAVHDEIVATVMPLGEAPAAAGKTLSVINLVTITAAASLCWGMIALAVMVLR
jgi:hypothetical protein